MKSLTVVFFVVVLSISAFAQTNAFTFQGKLEDKGAPANGTYLFKFRVLDAANNQVGSVISDMSCTVSNGIFTVQLDFGDTPFNGQMRYLEISVRPTVNDAYVTLAPNQALQRSPYAIRSSSAGHADSATNAGMLGGITPDQYVQTYDARLSDARAPTGGSSNYIQNSLATQVAASFTISGNGTALGTLSGGTVNAQNQYNLNGQPVLSATGFENFIVGTNAGPANTGGSNLFVGAYAGNHNTTGGGNAFLGTEAGINNTTGYSNTLVGWQAGHDVVSGVQNTFVGSNAGLFTNGSAGSNTFIGTDAGRYNTSGSNNTFFGTSAGDTNHSGSNNTMLGRQSEPGADNLTFATAIGALSIVQASNTIALGRSDGSDKVVVYGLGTAGSTQLCRNASNQISTCSSSLRYKTNVSRFSDGMSFLARLRPITFNWKDGGASDIGFGAEDVAKIDSRFVTYNDKGEVEGVKYDRLSVVFANALREQNEQIARQQSLIEGQRALIQQLQVRLDRLENDRRK